ncbi:polyketide cyclase [Rhizobium anhuiense]|uniref:Polyketide cyclase n=1 Tax=Rhizobium anhuiense TaxID=1184720 RepID=A0ABX4IXK2_9HYPH|nr:SRPBCC domain-containing protein [Rhizobium anhuiense]PDS40569.1 polyketide cyclase [Rhizobium anhuiense]PDS47532.1 polyketide cyclase [Rhizobium anhuiense]
MYEAIKWPQDMTPSRSPIHFTNELEVAACPETIWSLLVDPAAWPSFYPGVEHVELLDGHRALRLGTQFETNLAGQDVYASVQEFEPVTRIAWGGGPKASPESRAYHAWIITPTANGSHLWTEETMQGPLWIEIAKQAPDIFWRTHENLLEDLAKVATQHSRSSTK